MLATTTHRSANLNWIGSSELLVSPRFLSQSDLMNSMLYGGGSQRLSAGFPFECSGSHTRGGGSKIRGGEAEIWRDFLFNPWHNARYSSSVTFHVPLPRSTYHNGTTA